LSLDRPIRRLEVSVDGQPEVQERVGNVSDDASVNASKGIMDRVSVAEAAERLQVTQDAVYKRIKRGSIPWEKDSDGRTYVWIDASFDSRNESVDAATDVGRDPGDGPIGQSSRQYTDTSDARLVEVLQDQVTYLRQQLDDERAANRENRRIIGALTQRIPELEAPSEPRGWPERASEPSGKGAVPQGSSEEPTDRRSSWLYRFFFGP
jgi:excisionase family DNA binding protein